jgi:hypothetical protein
MNNNSTLTQTSQPEPETTDLTRYQILMNRRFTIEKIFWSRIQTLHAIQAGILGSGFILLMDDRRILSGFVFLFGALLTSLLYGLAHNDWNDASVNDCEYCILEKKVNIARTAGRQGIWRLLKSHSIMFSLIKLFLFIDAVFAVLAFSNFLLTALFSRS